MKRFRVHEVSSDEMIRVCPKVAIFNSFFYAKHHFPLLYSDRPLIVFVRLYQFRGCFACFRNPNLCFFGHLYNQRGSFWSLFEFMDMRLIKKRSRIYHVNLTYIRFYGCIRSIPQRNDS